MWLRRGRLGNIARPRSGATSHLLRLELARQFGADVVLNPAHPDFPRIRILEENPFRFDPRLPGFHTTA